MQPTYQITLEDALDHGVIVWEGASREDGEKQLAAYKAEGPSGYDLMMILEEITYDEDGEIDDYVFIDEVVWFTDESWLAAHPSGFPD